MSYYTPVSRLASAFPYPPPPLSTPRDRYLAALAEAKAAEAEYLAAEAFQREEEALRRRLEAIQLRKQEQELLLRYRRGSYPSSDSLLNLDTYGYDRLAAFRHQVEEEERLRLLAFRQAEAEQERRRQAEEAHLLSLKRKEQVALRLHQQPEAARATAHRELRAARARQGQLESAKVHQCNCINQRRCGNSYQPSRPRSECLEPLAFYPALQALLGPGAKAFAPAKSSSAEPKPSSQSLGVEVDVRELLNQLFSGQPEPLKPKNPVAARQPAPESGTLAPTLEQTSDILEQFANLFGLSAKEAQQQVTTQAPTSSPKAPTASHVEAEMLKQFSDLFGLSAAKQGQQSVPPSCAPSSKVPSDSPADIEPLQQAFNLFFGQPQGKPSKEEKQISTAPGPSKTPETSLKEQLESRLNNEYSSEVRDTIQAIFASLQDAESHSTPPSTSSDSAGSSKGKAKAAETSADASPSATSKDVVNSMNEVRSIETTFQVLEADFTFPTQLDFLAAHLASGSPASSDSEASATVHLAYTSRNHPVRFYEQALSTLLVKLDSVDSFGNEDLRGMRKEVVDRVERALEELEKEVEGRWRSRLSKEAKTVGVKVTEPLPTQPNESTAPSESAPDVPEEKVEPTAALTAEATSELSNASAPAIPAEAALHDSTVYINSQSVAPAEISDANDDTASSATSLAASVVTLKGYDVGPPAVEDALPVESESVEAFLLAAASDADAIPNRPNSKESDDGGSDWSDVEA